MRADISSQPDKASGLGRAGKSTGQTDCQTDKSTNQTNESNVLFERTKRARVSSASGHFKSTGQSERIRASGQVKWTNRLSNRPSERIRASGQVKRTNRLSNRQIKQAIQPDKASGLGRTGIYRSI
ncbi:MAG: hypothetical protein PHR96_04265 [Clostridia bacterium]|nr:hypothetical protein [Clostridia bacterium]